ncbi:MAG: CoB--CoM heterodisulfide reductase iron-sulfur subunit A family protein [Bacteroidetes bacterium]|nr:CoB--CoM heterodisulfide reductase iron-sulfur subunit A family protein [Bacteroidota bacterium]
MNPKTILVIGGGISGITTAVEAAETGYDVVLIEKLPYLGGRVVKMKEYFPKLCPPYCGLEINFRRIRQNPGIRVLTSAAVTKISGSIGNFTVNIHTGPELINDNCTACGECAKVCNAERSNEYNYFMDSTKAVYLPHEMAFPYRYTIDSEACSLCGKCKEVCKYEAIDLSRKASETEITAGAIVIATGWEHYNAKKIDNLGFGKYTDIITNVMFERMIADNGPTLGKIVRPSDGKEPENVVFVQCAGSRDEKHLPWCSAVCCTATLKHAMKIRKRIPGSKVHIFYIDLRVSGRNEDFLKKAESDENIRLIKGKAGSIEKDKTSGLLTVTAENVITGRIIKQQADLVVLATGMMPVNPLPVIIPGDPFGYIDRSRLPEGIIAVSNTVRPMDVSSSLKDATAAALRAIQSIHSS